MEISDLQEGIKPLEIVEYVDKQKIFSFLDKNQMVVQNKMNENVLWDL